MATFGSILCVINLSEHNTDILQYAKDFADEKSKIIVVHSMLPMSSLQSYLISNPMIEKIITDAKENATKYLDDLVSKDLNGYNVEKFLVSDKLEKEIERIVDEKCADIVIIGSMSTKGLSSLFNGKQTNNVIGTSRVPVLVVPNDLSLECMPEE